MSVRPPPRPRVLTATRITALSPPRRSTPGLRGLVRVAVLAVWAAVWAAEAREAVGVVDRVHPGCGASLRTRMYLMRYAGMCAMVIFGVIEVFIAVIILASFVYVFYV